MLDSVNLCSTIRTLFMTSLPWNPPSIELLIPILIEEVKFVHVILSYASFLLLVEDTHVFHGDHSSSISSTPSHSWSSVFKSVAFPEQSFTIKSTFDTPRSCAPCRTRETFHSKFGTRTVVSPRCYWGSGFVCSNGWLCLQVEIWNSWLLGSESEIYDSSVQKGLVDLTLWLARRDITCLRSILPWDNLHSHF